MPTWSEFKKTMRAEDEIFDSVRDGDLPALQKYLQNGGNVEVRTYKGHSLLMLAAYNNHVELCKVLIDRGADVNSMDHGGGTILMAVAFKGYTDIVRLLLEAGADPLIQNPHGMTALDFSKAFGRTEVIQILSSNPYSTLERISILVRMLNRMKS